MTDIQLGRTLQIRRQRALDRVGITQSDLARRLGVSRQAVHQVIAGTVRSERIERAIASYSGVPQRRLFPPPTTDGST